MQPIRNRRHGGWLAGLAAVFLFGGLTAGAALPDLLIADFESPTYGSWEVRGRAFGPGPAAGTLPNQMRVSGFKGRRLVNSYHGGDDTEGELLSPPFRIERPWINLLVGGGGWPGETCVDLLVDGAVVRTATGPNTKPGGSEALEWRSWDVREWIGRLARIRIVDHRRGGWGHINVDHIVQSTRRLEAVERTRTFEVTARYLLLPVRNGAPKRRMQIRLDGAVVREFDIEYAVEQPDFEVFADLTAFRGRKLTVVCRLPGGPEALEGLKLADELPVSWGLYREPLRPQYHFTSRRGWHNDPNGLVHYAGEFHLYYQHNPYGIQWGNMHWGHAVSPDLVHWKELPVALYPPRYGDWVFSGSAVVDWQNTSGFGRGGRPPLIAAWTSTGRGECIAWSLDRGRTFTEYEGNPVYRHRGRDPKIVWDRHRGRWVMAVYDEDKGSRDVLFLTSPDLKHWTPRGRAKGYYECPNFFEMPVEGEPGQSRWVLYGADGAYAVGAFDGEQFHPEHAGKHRLWHGNFYAAQNYSDAPEGRHIQIGWGRGITFPGMPFNQQMTLPVDLTLRRTPEGLRLTARPVKELESLHREALERERIGLPFDPETFAGLALDAHRIRLTLVAGQAEKAGLRVRGVEVVWEPGKGRLVCDGLEVPVPGWAVKDGSLALDLWLDRGSIEVFAADGAVAISKGVHFAPDQRGLEGVAEGTGARVEELRIIRLASIWFPENG